MRNRRLARRFVNVTFASTVLIGGMVSLTSREFAIANTVRDRIFKVTNNNDSGAGSLRQAIIDAGNTPGADIIDLTEVSGTIALDSPITVNAGNDLRLDDDGNTTLSGQGKTQIMTVRGSTNVVISRLTFENGTARGRAGDYGGGGGGLGAGGALFLESANITLNNVTFRNNQAIGGNGGEPGGHGSTLGGTARPGGQGGGMNGAAGSPGGNAGVRSSTRRQSGSPAQRGQGDGTLFGAGGGGGGGEVVAQKAGNGGQGGFGAGGGGGGGGFSGGHRASPPGDGGDAGKGGTFGGNGAPGGRGTFTSQTSSVPGSGGRGGGGAGLGGAIFIYSGKLTLFNCVFSSNTASGGSGASNGQGVGANIFKVAGNISSSTEISEAKDFDGNNGARDSTIESISLPFAYYENKGSIYSLSSSGTWQQAQVQAQSLGGNLVTIRDSTENSWLVNTFGGIPLLWIGLTDEVTEGQFKWASGETTIFRNWFDGEPNNNGGSQHYAKFNFRQPGRWDDDGGSESRQGIIEQRFYEFNGNRYLLSGAGTWEQAQAQAQNLGGNLVTIESDAEQEWLGNTFGKTEGFWIGLTDKAQEGQFRWANGSTSTFRNWWDREPNNTGDEDYVEMNFNSPGKWNDKTATASRRGIIEIPQFGAIGQSDESQFFTLARPTRLDISVSGGSGADVFQLQSYDGLTTSQRVWGRGGTDVFNVSIQGSSGIVGLDFNAGKLRKLAELLVEPDTEVREKRRKANHAAAGINAGISIGASGFKLVTKWDFTGLSGFALDSVTAAAQWANTIANIEINYNLDMVQYENSLRSIGNFFEDQGGQGWGTVNVTQKRSVIEVMDFEPGIDIITLPKLTGNEAYRYTVVSGRDGRTAVEVAYNNQTNEPSTFLRIYIAQNLLSKVLGQSVGVAQFIQSLFVLNSTNSVIGKTLNTSSRVAVGGVSYTGTIAGDYIYVAQDNPVQGNVKISGLDGDDIIAGRKDGGNELYGDGGDDLIAPGSMSDLIYGGTGYDQANYSGWNRAISLKLPLANTNCSDNSVSGNSSNPKICGIESIVGTAFDDTIDLSGLQTPPPDQSAFSLIGGTGADMLIGSQFQDVIDGQEDNDNLDGGPGDDSLDGGTGLDTLFGGTGNDRFILGSAAGASYIDNNIRTPGIDDYADIGDFSPGDTIQLHGDSSNYFLKVVGADTQIWLNNPAPESEELIGIVRSQTNLSLNSNDFIFIPKPNGELLP